MQQLIVIINILKEEGRSVCYGTNLKYVKLKDNNITTI